MNSLLILLIAIGCAAPSGLHVPIPDARPDTTGDLQLAVDTDRSVIRWKGTEMWETSKHEGTLRLKEGHLVISDGQLSGGRFVADMQTIAITDIPEDDPIPRRNLRKHLESDDFFHVEQYPTAVFSITETEHLPGDDTLVRGQLTIRDVTRPVSFTVSRKSERIYTASFTFDRFDWNVSYQGSYWDRLSSILDNTLVDADIVLTIELVLAVDG